MAVLLIIAVVLTFAGLRLLLQHRFAVNADPLVDAVDALLPQTQCAQCEYPGCRPYAEAIVHRQAPLNLCPPGGAQVHAQLLQLVGTDPARGGVPELPAPQAAPAALAVIEEADCIGCTLCLPPCPVDAIIGAQGVMHTVLEAECTGCGLCIPACPVDCISLQPALSPAHTQPPEPSAGAHPAAPANTRIHGCINCNRCDYACPLELPARDLLQLIETGQPQQAVHAGLMSCVECNLCDRACPSNIPLARIFGSEIRAARTEAQAGRERTRLKQRFAAHNQRLQSRADAAEEKRAARLANPPKADTWR